MRCAATLLLGCLLACGPQVFLQGLAWTGMAVTYSLQDGLSQGLSDTFSGERPCDMCIALSNDESMPPPAAATVELRVALSHYALSASTIQLPETSDGGHWRCHWPHLSHYAPWQGRPDLPVPRA